MDKKTYKLKDFAEPIAVAVTDPQKSCHNIFVGLEHYDSGEPVISRFSDTSLLNSSCKEFQKNDILIARRNVYLRRAGIAPFDGLTSGDSIVLRLFEDCEERTGISYDVAIKIIPFVLNSNSFWLYANRHADGMNSKRISKEKVLDYEFDLPSLAEQKVLAEKLWAAYEVKQSYLKMIAATEEMVKAQFIEMFGDTPKTKVGDFCELKARIGWQGLKHKEFLDNGDFYLVTGVDFVDNRVDWDNCHYVTKDRYDQDPNIQLSNGDVLITKDGTIGKVAIVSGLTKPATLNSGVFVIRDKQNLTINLFMFYALLSKDFENFVNDCRTGSTIAHLNQKAFVNYLFPTPPIDEQKIFVEIAKQADKSISELRKSVDAIDKVIKSLINENL